VPAIQPTRLKQQSAQLAEFFTRPPSFVRGLHNLLSLYAERASREGQSGTPAPLLTAYKVHPPVLRQVIQDITPLATQDPAAGFELCDALWKEPVFEFRQMACTLLGQLPSPEPDPVLQRVEGWIKPDLESHLINAVLAQGLVTVRKQHPQAIFQLIEKWLDRSNIFFQQIGLRALLPLAQDPQNDNLPVFFRLIHPLVRNAPSGLRPDLLDVLSQLARRSPKETAYFLRQTLNLPNSPDTPWIIRQLLSEFPGEIQTNLRSAMRGI
jgi:hypothetical protein